MSICIFFPHPDTFRCPLCYTGALAGISEKYTFEYRSVGDFTKHLRKKHASLEKIYRCGAECCRHVGKGAYPLKDVKQHFAKMHPAGAQPSRSAGARTVGEASSSVANANSISAGGRQPEMVESGGATVAVRPCPTAIATPVTSSSPVIEAACSSGSRNAEGRTYEHENGNNNENDDRYTMLNINSMTSRDAEGDVHIGTRNTSTRIHGNEGNTQLIRPVTHTVTNNRPPTNNENLNNMCIENNNASAKLTTSTITNSNTDSDIFTNTNSNLNMNTVVTTTCTINNSTNTITIVTNTYTTNNRNIEKRRGNHT